MQVGAKGAPETLLTCCVCHTQDARRPDDEESCVRPSHFCSRCQLLSWTKFLCAYWGGARLALMPIDQVKRQVSMTSLSPSRAFGHKNALIHFLFFTRRLYNETRPLVSEKRQKHRGPERPPDLYAKSRGTTLMGAAGAESREILNSPSAGSLRGGLGGCTSGGERDGRRGAAVRWGPMSPSAGASATRMGPLDKRCGSYVLYRSYRYIMVYMVVYCWLPHHT